MSDTQPQGRPSSIWKYQPHGKNIILPKITIIVITALHKLFVVLACLVIVGWIVSIISLLNPDLTWLTPLSVGRAYFGRGVGNVGLWDLSWKLNAGTWDLNWHLVETPHRVSIVSINLLYWFGMASLVFLAARKRVEFILPLVAIGLAFTLGSRLVTYNELDIAGKGFPDAWIVETWHLGFSHRFWWVGFLKDVIVYFGLGSLLAMGYAVFRRPASFVVPSWISRAVFGVLLLIIVAGYPVDVGVRIWHLCDRVIAIAARDGEEIWRTVPVFRKCAAFGQWFD